MALTIVPLTADTYKRIVGDRPWDVVSEGAIRHYEAVCTDATVMRCVAAIDSEGRPTGFGLAVTGPFDPTLSPRHFEIRIKVGQEFRGHGIGGALYVDLERFAINKGGVAIEACVGDANDTALAWAQRRGFVINQHVFSSRLDIRQAASSHQSWQGGARGDTVRFTTLAEYPTTDECFEKLSELYLHIMKDVPGIQDSERRCTIPPELRSRQIIS